MERVVELPAAFYDTPKTAETTMNMADVKALLLAKNGRIEAQGRTWEIKSKKIGPGVYRVTLGEAEKAPEKPSAELATQEVGGLDRFEKTVILLSDAVRT